MEWGGDIGNDLRHRTTSCRIPDEPRASRGAAFPVAIAWLWGRWGEPAANNADARSAPVIGACHYVDCGPQQRFFSSEGPVSGAFMQSSKGDQARAVAAGDCNSKWCREIPECES